MTALAIRWISRAEHRRAVARWHSHHKPTVGETFALGAFAGGALVAAGVMGIPVGPELQNGATWEVSRLAVGPDAPRYTASRLLGACGRVMDEAGITRQVSYTRVDEAGTCYKAAGWWPAGYVRGREHNTGNRATWLPGLHAQSTEQVDRVRWERGASAVPACAVFWCQPRGRWLPDLATVADELAALRRVA